MSNVRESGNQIRKCAICTTARVFRKDRLCADCLETWGTEEPWVQALIEMTDEEYRLERRTRERRAPISVTPYLVDPKHSTEAPWIRPRTSSRIRGGAQYLPDEEK